MHIIYAVTCLLNVNVNAYYGWIMKRRQTKKLAGESDGTDRT